MEESMGNKSIPYTPSQARLKAEAFCAFQERSQQEVRDKVYAWGLKKDEVEHVIAELIEADFLNEERFAKAYAGGKFRLKGWGKFKIRQGLLQKAVSAPLVSMALAYINEDEYREKLTELLTKKASSLRENDAYKRKYKLTQYALGKGYEPELVYEILNNNNL